LKAFLAAREFLLEHRKNYERAYRDFRWPQLNKFNWALDYFDTYARANEKPALWIVDDAGPEIKLSFAEMSRRSNQVANFLREQNVRRGDRVVVQLSNHVATWEIMLAAIKLGANFPSLSGDYGRILVGGEEKGWTPYSRAYDHSADFTAQGDTNAHDPLMLYFTSATTALPKLVLHTHQSYPVGHLTTMFWIGIRPDDAHFNISTPGWAKACLEQLFRSLERRRHHLCPQL
jgi:acetyl-CoA synthetase